MNQSSASFGTSIFQRFTWQAWVLVLAVSGSSDLVLAQGLPTIQPHVVIVQFETDLQLAEGAAKTGQAAFDRAMSRYGATSFERAFGFLDHVDPNPKIARNLAALRRTYYVRYHASDNPSDVGRVLDSLPGVANAEAVPVSRLWGPVPGANPNDSLYSDQAYLRQMRLPAAWELVKGQDGQPPAVIAIVDGGGDWRHADLLGNVWTNEFEVAGNGLDDDGNGFIDDVHGINLVNGDDADNDPIGLQRAPVSAWHGTAVAGAANAVTNNTQGVAGAAWNARLMHVNAGCHLSDQEICHGYEGILYAAANGADIISASWGWSVEDSGARLVTQVLDLATDLGALVVAAAGNGNVSIDKNAWYPAAHPRVLSVGATSGNELRKATFSNYGKLVSVFAPGTGIVTTTPGSGYSNSAVGTSFAAALACGVAALVKTRFPFITPDALREHVRLASHSIDSANPGYAGQLGRGIVNAQSALMPSLRPAVRVKSWSWTGTSGDRRISSGATVTVRATIVNYLSDARNLTIELKAAESYPYIDITKAENNVGRLRQGDSTQVTFQLRVDSTAPENRRLRFYTGVRDGEFEDEPDQLVLEIRSASPGIVVHSALAALYVSTNGNSWHNNSGWNISTVPTESQLARWHGITLHDGRLVALNLTHNNLAGMLPAELGNLSDLAQIYLYENSLTGRLPAELGKLSNLRVLYLYENSLSGEVPKQLGNLSQLDVLSLWANEFTGPIPIELGNLSQLQKLYLTYNALTGPIPPELGKLERLRELSLHHNSLTGPIPGELGNLSAIVWLRVDSNSLSGTVPGELGNLPAMEWLDVSGNNLTGALPRSLLKLTKLKEFHFGGQALCAPRDSEFLDWMRRIANASGPTCAPMRFTTYVVEDLSLTVGEAVPTITLPAASGGAPPYVYTIDPSLPAGLVLDSTDRSISGMPSVPADNALYTYTAADESGDAVSLTFSIEVLAPTTAASREIPPDRFQLHGSYPNPFTATSSLVFDLPWPANVSVDVQDIVGRRIRTVPPTELDAGWEHTMEFSGVGLAPGLYIYRITVNSPVGIEVRVGSLMLVR